jgi:hypothetical protein
MSPVSPDEVRIRWHLRDEGKLLGIRVKVVDLD